MSQIPLTVTTFPPKGGDHVCGRGGGFYEDLRKDRILVQTGLGDVLHIAIHMAECLRRPQENGVE